MIYIFSLQVKIKIAMFGVLCKIMMKINKKNLIFRKNTLSNYTFILIPKFFLLEAKIYFVYLVMKQEKIRDNFVFIK